MSVPNIIFIMADQLRRDALGCYGNGVVQTPHIDSLASRGARFDHMYAAYPVCAPNRASIFTGRYPSCHKVTDNGRRLPASETTLMDVLRTEGYRTYGTGKMHFGPQWQFPPNGEPLINPDRSLAINPQPDSGEFPWYGFDEVMITEDHRVGPYEDYLKQHGLSLDGELDSASYPQSSSDASPIPEEHHQTTWITNNAIQFLQDHQHGNVDAAPFFLNVSYVHPHHPFNPPEPYDTMYDPADMPLPIWDETEPDRWPDAYRHKFNAAGSSHEAVALNTFSDVDWKRIKAVYYGMVSQIDAAIGRILDVLESTGEIDNTLVFFTADHGEMLGDHRLLFKGTTYDCVTGVPFIGAGPGIPESVSDRLCSSVDIMPTILSAAGISAPVPSPIQGSSLLNDHSGGDAANAVIIENGGVRRSVRTAEALYTFHGPGMRGELYDLIQDPHCLSNLWSDQESITLRTAMGELLVDLMARSATDPLPPKEGVW